MPYQRPIFSLTDCILEFTLKDLIKAIKILIEIIGWLVIAGGITLVAGIISFTVYSKRGNTTIPFVILIVGFVIGAIWATRISIKYGTMAWLSEVRRIS